MTAPSRHLLSASSYGDGILVTAVASPGTLVHTAVSGTAQADHVYLYMSTTYAANVPVFVEWGGTQDRDRIQLSVTSRDGLYAVTPGIPLNQAKAVRVYTPGQGSVLLVAGYVNRMDIG